MVKKYVDLDLCEPLFTPDQEEDIKEAYLKAIRTQSPELLKHFLALPEEIRHLGFSSFSLGIALGQAAILEGVGE